MFPLMLLCLVLLVSSLLGGPTITAAAAAIVKTVSENPLLVAESILDHTMTCPLVFSAVLFVAFVLLSFVPACASVHERLSSVDGPVTVAKEVSIVRASPAGKHMAAVWSPLRTTLSRAYYSQDGVLGVARLAANLAVYPFRQTWVHSLYRWISPSDEVVLLGVLFVSAISFLFLPGAGARELANCATRCRLLCIADTSTSVHQPASISLAFYSGSPTIPGCVLQVVTMS